MKLFHVILLLSGFLVCLTPGCGGPEKTKEDEGSEAVQLVQVSHKQFESEGMKIGDASMQPFDDEVTCNGYIMAPANGMAQISAPLAGIVEAVHCATGEYVKKGQTLCMISGNELMLMQLDFAETSAKLKRLESDYKRIQALYNEKIGAEKDFMAIESDYRSMKSKYQSLKLRLEHLKLDVSKIEAGEPYAAYAVKSPLNGYITSVNLVLGQFTEQQKSLIEIVDVSQLQLQLLVFENDVSKLKAGQAVRFNSLNEPVTGHAATLMSIGKTINPESRTIQCIAKIENGVGTDLINRTYVEAKVTVAQKKAMALPNDAFVKSGKDHFIFIVEKQKDQTYYLRRVKVSIGKTSGDYTEISGGTDFKTVLIKGVYNLPAE
jgi:cobalt-zinc-cadmium efflux system membrane fusion protein